jgi:hypothetical protein
MKYILFLCMACFGFSSCITEYTPHCRPPKNKETKALYKRNGRHV